MIDSHDTLISHDKTVDMIALEIEQELKSKQPKIKVKKKKDYLNNKDFYDEIVKSKEQDKLTPTAEKMLMLLAERAITKIIRVSTFSIK